MSRPPISPPDLRSPTSLRTNRLVPVHHGERAARYKPGLAAIAQISGSARGAARADTEGEEKRRQAGAVVRPTSPSRRTTAADAPQRPSRRTTPTPPLRQRIQKAALNAASRRIPGSDFSLLGTVSQASCRIARHRLEVATSRLPAT